MSTLKEVAGEQQLVTNIALEESLTRLKSYIDSQDTSESTAREAAIQGLQDELDALVGGEPDVDNIINTFKEIKDFLADYTEDDTLKSLIDAVETAVSNEETRAKAAEQANTNAITAEVTRATAAENDLSGRVTTLENVEVMTAQQASDLFDDVF